MTDTTVENDSFLGLKFVAALVFLTLFLCGVAYILIGWADEGPDLPYTPPAYTRP